MIDIIVNTFIITLVVYYVTDMSLDRDIYIGLAVAVLVTLGLLRSFKSNIEEPFESNSYDENQKDGSYYCDGDVCKRVGLTENSVENCLPRTVRSVNDSKPKTNDCDLLDYSNEEEESDSEDIKINLDETIPSEYLKNKLF